MSEISKEFREAFEKWADFQRFCYSQSKFWRANGKDGYTHPSLDAAWLAWKARHEELVAKGEAKTLALEEAFDKGFVTAAEWANREDLLSDMASSAYEKDKAKRIREEG